MKIKTGTAMAITLSALLSGCASGPPTSSPSLSTLSLSTPVSASPVVRRNSGTANDVNGDGFADLVFTTGCGVGCRNLNVVYGSRMGLNPRARTVVSGTGFEFDMSHFGRSMNTADLDGDGFADVVVYGRPKATRGDVLPHRVPGDDIVPDRGKTHATGEKSAPSMPYILWGGPKGVQGGAKPPTAVHMPFKPEYGGPTVTGDFNGDGVGDLAAPVQRGGVVDVYQRDLAVLYGPFTRVGAAHRHTIQPGTQISDLLASPINGRRATDLLVHAGGDGEQARSWWFEGGPGGLSRQHRELNRGNSGAFGDFNGDGITDVVVADNGSRNDEPENETEPPEIDRVMTVYFGGAKRTSQVFRNIGPARDLVAGDYDGDRHDDLAMAFCADGYDDGERKTPCAPRVEVLHGSADGLRHGVVTIPKRGPDRGEHGRKLGEWERAAKLWAAADYDHDGRDELATTFAPGWLAGDRSRWWVTDGKRDESSFTTDGW